MPLQPERHKSDRVAIACRTCRRRKVRCTGGHPCRNCSRLTIECSYPLQQRRKRSKNPDAGRAIDRPADVEDAVHVSDDDGVIYILQSPPMASEVRPCLPANAGCTGSVMRRDQETRTTQDPSPALSLLASRTQELELPPRLLQQHLSSKGLGTKGPFDLSPAGINLSDSSATITGQSHAYEVAGSKEQYPSPWMSACSDAGVAWVCEATESRTFATITERFTRSMDQRLSASTGLALDTKRIEPTEAPAWEYVNAFFENCQEAHLGFIHRSDFEAQLQAHFHDETSSRSDYAEIALRNIVFAAGYRSILAKSTVSLTTAQTDSWQCYFKNALSALTELLLLPSRLMVVQALALMACYVEGLGSPGFQGILCCNAVHTAIIQGLHRESDHLTNSSSDDGLKKAWLWWAVYALEKHLSLSSGRPSMIDDDIVSTQVPSKVPLDSNMDLESLTLVIRHAKICSRISREIISPKAQTLSAHDLHKAVKDLDQQLKNLLDEIPPSLRIGTLAKLSEEVHPTSRRIHALHLHFSIYGSLLAVHSHFFYPWLSSRFSGHDADAILDAQVAFSSSTVAEAARKILLAVRTVTTSIATPTWLALSYPIYAHLSLFIFVLRYPTLPTASADLGLLDICAGHFGYIDFMSSSEISVSLPRDSVNLAAKVVKAARRKQHKDKAASLSHVHGTQSDNAQSKPSEDHSPNQTHSRSASTALSQPGSFTEVDLGAWNLLPSFDTIRPNDYNL